MKLTKALAAGAAAIALTAAWGGTAMAQVTSSKLNGQVVDANGQAVTGATVTITYEPTGNTYTATTSDSGVYLDTGLQVGGPYTIEVTTPAGTTRQENVFLKPGAGNTVNLVVAPQASDDVIVVTGTAIGSRIELNNGVGSTFTADDILSQPSTERDLIATLVRDPLAFSNGEGNLSVAGANPRFNALSIDGSLQQDDFGLSSSTYPTARSPISLDTIAAASVAASDYSVESSGFTGGLVNIVTKSGTNEFDGSIFYYRQDEDYLGNITDGTLVDQAAFKEEEYGFTLGGPLIEDKLFFFVSYDEFESASGSNFTQSDIDNDRNPAIFDAINQIVLDTYGFDMGGRPSVVNNPVTSERFLGKIDWNINDIHRASFTLQQTEESGVSGVGATTFTSAYYATPSTLDAYTAQLFSDWRDDFSTEFRINYKEFQRAQNCNAGDTIGEFDIRLSEADLVGTALEGFLDDGDANTAETNNTLFLTGGCDRFRQGNTFEDERLQIFGAGNLIKGDHLITFGGEYESYELANLFAQRSVGEFRFETLDQLQNQIADRVEVQLPDTGNRADILAAWGYDKIALFAQDSWQVNPDFRLDYGIRYERFIQDDKPQARQFFADRYGFSNSENLDGNDLIMPRVSFEWTPKDRTRVTGGFGLFGGGDPKVWTSNAFTPPVFFARADDVTGVNPASGTPQVLIGTITGNDANDPGPIDVISPDFETPSDWKASLRVDQEFDLVFGDKFDFGNDWLASFQILYSATNEGFRWENLAQTQLSASLPLGTAPDGRPIYADLDELGINNAIALTNFDAGESLTFAASLDKEFENGLSMFLSYAHQDIETVTPGTSSRGVSNFRAIVDSDRNDPVAGTAPFQVEHAFKVNLSYDTEIFGDLNSRFNLFGQITSGEPFSYTFDVGTLNVNGNFENNALFGRSGDGEGPFDNDLLYIPTISGGVINDPSVVLANGFDEAGFIEYIQAAGLNSGIQSKNNDESTWNQRWDFQLQQELPLPGINNRHFQDHKLKFVLDIENVLNLLNDEWGTQFNGPGFDTRGIVQADLVSAADVAANGIDGAAALTGDAPRTTCVVSTDCLYRFNDFDDDETSFQNLNASVYEIRVGLRYEF
ncbi:MAG: TonB-dependent receptor [Aquisalinus sp.]|nr:TonB-dependent receptor [Aquisalinus sp.]